MQASRYFTWDGRPLDTGGYPINSLRIGWWPCYDPILAIPGVESVDIGSLHNFNSETHIWHAPSKWGPVELPAGVRRAVLGVGFNEPVTLPDGLTEISFAPESDFNYPITLPSTIEKAQFGRGFRQPVELLHCSRLREITFGDGFDAQVTLPPTLEAVNFGWKFNKPVDIPPRLEELIFHRYGQFNQVLNLPESGFLRRLKLSETFSHPINLPEGLDYVSFGMEFDFPITLPTTLTTLMFELKSEYNHPINLPDGIVHVCFGEGMKQTVALPPSLRKLEWASDFPIQLNEGLVAATFCMGFRQPLTLPMSLRTLMMDFEYFEEFAVDLPPGCEVIETYCPTIYIGYQGVYL